MNAVDVAPFDLLSAMHRDEPMATIWSEAAVVSSWLRVEAELANAQAASGLINEADADAIASVCTLTRIDVPALWSESRKVGYPILPLVRQISALLPEGPNGRVHFGATTQDIMDSGLALQLVAACGRVESLLLLFGDALCRQVEAHAMTAMVARTHAQVAVPTTFGAKLAVFLEEVRIGLVRTREMRCAVGTVSLFGAGGTSAAMGEHGPAVRTGLAQRLGLTDTDIPWHVSRTRVVRYAQELATLASVSARFAREIIDLSRTEIDEVREQGGHHRGASSTMPQKTNPITSECVIGFAGVATATSAALYRAMEAGHERAAGEWQIEWMALPAISMAAAGALALAAQTAGALDVRVDRMRRNLGLEHGLVMSEAGMIRLAAVMGREAAHDVMYEVASECRRSDRELVEVLRSRLDAQHFELIGSLDPTGYVGEAPAVSRRAVDKWIATPRDQPCSESGPSS